MKPTKRSAWTWLFLALLLPSLPSAAGADEACPEGNLLAGRRPVRFEDVEGVERFTDGVAPDEGDLWDSSVTGKFTTASAQVIYDLGREVHLRALLIQADNNDTYPISGSLDGKTWTPVWTAPMAEGMGMRVRTADNLDAAVRFLRVADMKGDSAYSIGELQAYCAKPATWPPDIARKKGVVVDHDKERLDQESRRKAVFALAGLAVFVFLLGGDRRRTFWTEYGPAAGAAALLLYGAGFTGGWQGQLGAAAFIAGAAWWLWSDAKNGIPWQPRADALGVIALGIGTAFAFDRASVTTAHAMAVGSAAYLAVVVALRLGDRRWTAAIPPAAALAYGTFAAYWSFGAKGAEIAGVVGGVAALGAWLLPKDWEAKRRWLERHALVLLVLGGPITWTNFVVFHGGRAVHFHDTFHYYMGSKYFRETGYTLLYHCAAVAEVDEGLGDKVEKRKIRNLTTNLLEPAKDEISDVESCRQAFTPERWAAFQQDIRLFRGFFGGQYWERIFHDHGYNASPVWTAFGQAFSNADWKAWAAGVPPGGPGVNSDARKAWWASHWKDYQADEKRFDERMGYIALIDASLYAGIFLLIGWAFGLRAMALACVLWGAGYPWAYFWTGGAFGRVLWLFLSTAGLCFLKKGRQLLGGAGLMGGLLDRVFPGALFAGVGLKVGWSLWKERAISTPHKRFIAGAVLAAAVAVPAALPATGGLHAWVDFWHNSQKHVETPLTNHMGLPTLYTYKPSAIAQKTKNDALEDPYEPWKQLRRDILHARAPVWYASVLALLWLVWAVGRRMEDWEVTAASTVMIVALFQLTCYYYNFCIFLAPLALKRLRHAVAVIGMVAAGQYVQLNIGWFDVQYTVESAVVLGAMLFILGDRLYEDWRAAQALPAEAEAPVPPASVSA